jgi:hypothetical protein
MEADMAQEYYIADMRPEWRGKPYITFWRPKDAGYAFPLPWSGRYAAETVIAGGSYYTLREGRSLIRFAVPVEAVERIATAPKPRDIDGDVGPVVANNGANRRALRAAAFLPSPSTGGRNGMETNA